MNTTVPKAAQHERVSIPLTEAGVILACSRPKLYDLINAGVLKTYTIGNRRFTTKSYIDECIRTLTKRSTVRKISAPRAHLEAIDAIREEAEEGMGDV